MEIVVAKELLVANDQIAESNLNRLNRAQVYCVNILGSPGSGKTTLLEAMSDHLKSAFRFGVIEGDLATSRDAERIEALGVPAVQVNTGGGCHLDAIMVDSALRNFDLSAIDVLFIENVGNLVCPASFKLGESLRIVLLSVPEGDDKIAKYPTMFSRVDAIVINKVDLIEHLDFDLNKVVTDIKVIAPDVKVFNVSAKTGEGIVELKDWLVERSNSYIQKL